LTQQEIEWCAGENATPDLKIKGCTALIQSGKLLGKDLASAHRNRGLAYVKRGDYAGAVADFDEAIRLNPQFSFAYNSRGYAYAMKGDFDRAIADYNEAIRLDPRYGLALLNRGLAYFTKHDYDRAIAGGAD
jgi:tetratricopeptide (TPR) repeat protein